MNTQFNRLKLLKNSSFFNFCLSGFIATFGNGLITVSLFWNSKEVFVKVENMAFYLLLWWAPTILLASQIGKWVDQGNPKKFITVSNFVRGALILSYAIALYFYPLQNNLLILFSLAFFLGLFYSFYGPAAMTLIRYFFPQDKLVEANSLVDISYELGSILGMGASGIIISITSSTLCLLGGGICFLIAAFLLIWVKVQPSEQSEEITNEDFRLLAYLLKNPRTTLLYLAQTFIMVIFMTLPSMIVPYANGILKCTNQQFGFFESSFSCCVVFGGVFFPIIYRKKYGGLIIPIVLLALSLALLSLAQIKEYFLAIISYGIVGMGLSVWSLVLSKGQEITPMQFQGRIIAFFNALGGVLALLFFSFLSLFQQEVTSLMVQQSLLAFFCMLLTLFTLMNYPPPKKDLC